MKPEIPNRFYRVSIKALLLDETRTKFLIIKEDNDKWELPGGGLDWGEEPEVGLVREIKEEMGLQVTWMDERPSYFISTKNLKGDTHIVNVLYEVKVKDLEFIPSDECIEVRFVTVDEVKELDTFPNVQAFAEMFDPKNHLPR